MILFRGTASEQLGGKIAAKLGATTGKLERRRFPDGELYLRVESEVEGKEAVIVQSTSAPQDENILELLFLADTLRDLGASRITAVVPYMGYARQDRRFKGGEALTSKTFATFLQHSCDAFYSVNLHKGAILEYFEIPAAELDASPLLAEHFTKLDLESPLVITPDRGAARLGEVVAGALSCELDAVEKKRLGPGRVASRFEGKDVKGRDVVLVDDIIDSGSTMVGAIKLLSAGNPSSIHVACIHALLTGDALEKMLAAGAEAVIATDTIPSEVSRVSVAPLIASALSK